MQKGGTNLILIRQANKCQISSQNACVLVLERKMCSEVVPIQLYEVLSHLLNCVLIFLKALAPG